MQTDDFAMSKTMDEHWWLYELFQKIAIEICGKLQREKNFFSRYFTIFLNSNITFIAIHPNLKNIYQGLKVLIEYTNKIRFLQNNAEVEL